MSFADEMQRDRRLTILRLLEEARGTANESVLHSGLNMAGHRRGLTRVMVREDMQFLEGSGCVTLDWFQDRVVVATITARGLDAAHGDIEIEGVKRPRVGE